ncbi:hypothetical protein SteCoe_3422 [Stentor coeruleus]|uniref:Ubiquitin carboxyl-terminal hydrolase n=1 Tax=Stentor coeruleus TaxID=5963 RepID=A0A1R2CX50_9CILI|nr:hypothetical protein SteCoe_3422 [Stentor coeruleus]
MSNDDREILLEVLDWINGKNDDVERIQGHPKANTKWYIVSCKWLNKWKRLSNLSKEPIIDNDFTELGAIDSEDIIDFTIKAKPEGILILKPGLRVGRDFEFLPEKAWDFLSNRYNYLHKIVRKSVQVNEKTTQIEIALLSIRVIYVIERELKSEIPQTYFVSHKELLSSVISILEKGNVPDYSCDSKLWKLNSETTPFELAKLIQSSNKSSFIFPGSQCDDTSLTIDSYQILPTDILVIEGRENFGINDFFKEKPKEKEMCEKCHKFSNKGRRCKCGRYNYCNDFCEKNDSFHDCRKKTMNNTQNSTSCMGRVGLQNLGNTCYMNSGLQCLANTYELTQYILNDEYIDDLNLNSVLGSKGNELTREYADLIKEMWNGSNHCISPWGVKNAFGKFAMQFFGYNQQDSQEMLGFLIDGLHEDLNRIKVKPYVEDPNLRSTGESELARRFWENHKLRNDSIITDLMHGQFRSEVECPLCNKISLSFDPFLMISLPIPESFSKCAEFIYIDGNKAIKAKAIVEKGSRVRGIVESACEIFNLRYNEVIAAEIDSEYIDSFVYEADKISKRSILAIYKKSDIQIAEENKSNSCVIFLNFKKKYYELDGRSIGQPQLLCVNKNITLKELYKVVFDYVIKLKSGVVSGNEQLFAENFGKFNARVNKNITLKELYKVVFDYVIKLKSGVVSGNEQLFAENFGKFNAKGRNDNFFNLKICNPKQFSCVICDKLMCNGCIIMYEDTILATYLNKLKENNLRITVLFQESLDETTIFSNVQEHISYSNTKSPKKSNDIIHISKCFELFSEREKLDQQNSVFCSNCRTHVEGFKKMEVYRLPRILILHFKRFKQKSLFSSKNSKSIEFPIEGFDMSQCTRFCRGIYDLYAVSNHFGSLEGGHYTAYAKSQDGQWRNFDDSSVSIVQNVRNIVGPSAYVLFYRLRD